MRLLRPIPGRLPFRHPAVLIATWGGVGLLRGPSGTWGSLAALPFGWILLTVTGVAGLAVATVIAAAAGWWAAARLQRAGASKDPSAIVIDEVAGLWIALLPTAGVPLLVVVALIGFRVLDVAKPWPISWADRELGGATGIMLDDLMAGAAVAGLIMLGTAVFAAVG